MTPRYGTKEKKQRKKNYCFFFISPLPPVVVFHVLLVA